METINRKLPVYELLIEDDSDGLEAIALVANPAIQSNFVAYSAGKQVVAQWKLTLEGVVTGPILIPGNYIYRSASQNLPERFEMVSSETIRKAIKRFFRQGRQMQLNLEHNPAAVVAGTVFETWISLDSLVDKSAVLGFNLPAGTAYMSVQLDKIEDVELIVNESIRGFSIEGLFSTAAKNIDIGAPTLPVLEPDENALEQELLTALKKLL